VMVSRPRVYVLAAPWLQSSACFRIHSAPGAEDAAILPDAPNFISYSSNSHSMSPGVRKDSSSASLLDLTIDRCVLHAEDLSVTEASTFLSRTSASVTATSVLTEGDASSPPVTAVHSSMHVEVGRVEFSIGRQSFDVLSQVGDGLAMLSSQSRRGSGQCRPASVEAKVGTRSAG
jgi:hypothetical protein